MQIARQQVIDVLRRAGWRDVADAAAHSLPDPVDIDQVAKFAAKYGVTRDELISRMGGSP